MQKTIKAFVVAVCAIGITILVIYGFKLRIENRDAYWEWYIENNIATNSVIFFTLLIVWLIVREIRDTFDN